MASDCYLWTDEWLSPCTEGEHMFTVIKNEGGGFGSVECAKCGEGLVVKVHYQGFARFYKSDEVHVVAQPPSKVTEAQFRDLQRLDPRRRRMMERICRNINRLYERPRQGDY